MINVLNQQISTTEPDSTYICYMCYVRTYCQIRCSVCNIPHKCKDNDCVETLAKANKCFTNK